MITQMPDYLIRCHNNDKADSNFISLNEVRFPTNKFRQVLAYK